MKFTVSTTPVRFTSAIHQSMSCVNFTEVNFTGSRGKHHRFPIADVGGWDCHCEAPPRPYLALISVKMRPAELELRRACFRALSANDGAGQPVVVSAGQATQADFRIV